MKRLVAAVSFAVLAAPVFAQPQGLGPTSPIGPSWVFGFNGAPTSSAAVTAQTQQDHSQVASSGATRSDTEIRPGYFDPSR